VLRPLSIYIRPDFARVVAERFAPAHLLLLGSQSEQLAEQCRHARLLTTICGTVEEIPTAVPQNGAGWPFDLAIWFYAPENAGREDETIIERVAALTGDLFLIPAQGTEVGRRRPQLVEQLRARGFSPDYGCDLSELESSAIRLTRERVETVGTLLPQVEQAFARLNTQMRGLRRTLHTRMSELEAADRHIARLEEKVLKLKEAKRELKQLKVDKQTLRKSPERKIGQIILAPYRLPQRLIRAVRKQWPKSGVVRNRSASPNEYQKWLFRHRIDAAGIVTMRAEARAFSVQPLISLITPVFNTPPRWLEEAVQSVLNQTYENWELVLVNDGSTNPETLSSLPAIVSRDQRIVLVTRDASGGISAASNDGIAKARGEWIGLLDHDDLLEPDALFQGIKFLQTQPDADLIYSDEDKVTEEGFDAPLLKPDWSPDFFLSYNYVCHFTTVRRALVEEVGGFKSEFDGAQDYDLFLRVTERTQRIHHIPRVLYHWRRSDTSTSDNIRRKPQALEAGRRAIDEHLKRRGEAGHVAIDWRTHAYWVKRELTEAKKISVIIATRDHVDLLARCLESLTTKTSYPNYEIIVVDNDSQSEQARDYLAQLNHRVLRYNGPFNFSAINNFAVEETDSPWLLFLNNDVEVIDSDWLTVMAEHVQRPEVGAVGARLIYPDETIQHAGVVLGVGGIAEHAFRGFPAEDPGVCRQLQVTRNYASVTGACLLTRRDVFEKVGGFDEEQLPVTFNDVDLCLKMRRAGYLIVYTPFAKLYHHESASRRRSYEALETAVFRERWPEILERDPYYNPNLCRERADFSLGK
jgi:GT2 family glycosyltransferase